MMGWFANEAKEWKKTNPIANIGKHHAGKKSEHFDQLTKELGKRFARANPKHNAQLVLEREQRKTERFRRQSDDMYRMLMNERQANKELLDKIANEAGKKQNYKDSIRNIRQMAGGK